MAETARSRVAWIRKWRERRRLKRDRDREKAGPAAARRGSETEYDEDRLHKIGRGSMFG